MTATLLETFQRARRVARDLVSEDGFVSHVYSGCVGGDGTPVTAHFHGRKRFSHDCGMLFDDGMGTLQETHPREETGALRFLMDGRHQTTPDTADISLQDAFLGPPDPQPGPLFAPYVDAVLPIMPTLEEQLQLLHSNGTRKKLSHLFRSGFRWHLSTRLADFDHFYSDMYLPTVSARFGSNGWVTPREHLEATFLKSGSLLFACADDGTPQIGALLCTVPHRPLTLHYWKTGVAHCESLSAHGLSEQYSRLEGAILQHAVREQYEDVHFGVTRALANDGVFIHKQRLGCTIQHNALYMDAEVWVKPSLRARLFQHRPMGLWRGKQLMFWIGQDGELELQDVPSLKARLRACCSSPVTLHTRGVARSRDLLLSAVAEAQRNHRCPIEVVEQS